MPRKVPIHWEGEQAVLQHRADEVWAKLQPLSKKKTKVMEAVLGSPEHKLCLIGICRDHLTWRDQEKLALGTAAGNKQLRVIATEARAITPDRADRKEAVVGLQGKIAGLANEPGFLIGCKLRALGSSLEIYTGIDVDDLDWSLLAAACDASISNKRGRSVDGSLSLTLQRLVDLYECVTRKTFTHNPASRLGYDGRLHSACDRFVFSVMKAIEPGIHETLICTYLQELKERRSAKAKAAQGGRYKVPKPCMG